MCCYFSKSARLPLTGKRRGVAFFFSAFQLLNLSLALDPSGLGTTLTTSIEPPCDVDAGAKPPPPTVVPRPPGIGFEVVKFKARERRENGLHLAQTRSTAAAGQFRNSLNILLEIAVPCYLLVVFPIQRGGVQQVQGSVVGRNGRQKEGATCIVT